MGDFEILKQGFLEDVRVLDMERGYLSVPSFNVRMDPHYLQAAARLILNAFKAETIDVIHGIPNSGHFLATAVSLQSESKVRLHNSRKDTQIPTAWKEVVRAEVRSFSSQPGTFDTFSNLTFTSVHKGDRVLIVDDMCARGSTGIQVIGSLQAAGAQVVGFAVMLDKVFQGGLERIGTLGVKTYSCIRVLDVKTKPCKVAPFLG